MDMYRFTTVWIFLASLCTTVLSANINGIKIEIVEAQKYGSVHIPLVEKHLHVNVDMFHLGYMIAGEKTKSLIDKEKFYVVSLKDNDSKGTLHAIVKGDYMRRYQYNISVLTELAFILSKKFLGSQYDAFKVQNNLNTIAHKVIKEKGFVLDNHYEINYTDILLYEDGVHVLYKSFDDDVRPLQEKIKNGTLTYKDAYGFVYEKAASKTVAGKGKVKTVKPLYRLVVFKHVDKNAKIGTEIVKLKQLRKGSAKVDGFEILQSNIPFRIDQEGSVRVSSELKKRSYSFVVVAHTKDGDSNDIDFTILIDPNHTSSFYKLHD